MAKAKGNPRGSGYKRAREDFYIESPAAVYALLRAVPLVGSIYDPCCGSGNVVKSVRVFAGRSQYPVAGSDIVKRWARATRGDFFEAKTIRTMRRKLGGSIGNIVMNPPYRRAVEFINRALLIADRKVCVFLRLAFLEGERWENNHAMAAHFARLLPFIDRVSCPPGKLFLAGKVKRKGGFVAYAWFIFDTQSTPQGFTGRHIRAGERRK